MIVLIAAAAAAGIGALAGIVLLSKFVAPTLNPGPEVRAESRAIMRRRGRFCFILEAVATIALIVLTVAFSWMFPTAVGEPQSSPALWIQIALVVSGVVALAATAATVTVSVGARRRAGWLLPPTESIPTERTPLTLRLLLVVAIFGVLAAFAFEGSSKTLFAVVLLAVLFPAAQVTVVTADWAVFAVKAAAHAFLRSAAAGNERAVKAATTLSNCGRGFEPRKGRARKGPVSGIAVHRLTRLTLSAAPTRPDLGSVATLALSMSLASALVAWQVRRPALAEVAIAYNKAPGGAVSAADGWPQLVQMFLMTAIALGVLLYGFRLMLGSFANHDRPSLRRIKSVA
ncbi:hypothetical protein [Gordonia aichiensis]|uniref:hypothetical protein n=1 Tax=Gordonia aichiensis TaxID=36820 RepID=UPI00326560AF